MMMRFLKHKIQYWPNFISTKMISCVYRRYIKNSRYIGRGRSGAKVKTVCKSCLTTSLMCYSTNNLEGKAMLFKIEIFAFMPWLWQPYTTLHLIGNDVSSIVMRPLWTHFIPIISNQPNHQIAAADILIPLLVLRRQVFPLDQSEVCILDCLSMKNSDLHFLGVL